MTARQPRVHSEDFRREAVRLAESGTIPLAQLAQELSIHPVTLRSWRRQARTSGDGLERPAVERPGTVLSLEEENRQLRRENARLLEEREILKKAAAFFAKDAR
jgi:transposase